MEFEPNPARSEGYILVVDDVPAMAELIAKWLEKAGYNTKIAHSYDSARQFIGNSLPRLAVLDDCHGDESLYDAFPLYSENREWLYPDILFLVLTEDGKRWKTEIGYCAHGIDMMLTKPFTPMVLIAFCDRILGISVCRRQPSSSLDILPCSSSGENTSTPRKPSQKHWKRRNRRSKKKN